MKNMPFDLEQDPPVDTTSGFQYTAIGLGQIAVSKGADLCFGDRRTTAWIRKAGSPTVYYTLCGYIDDDWGRALLYEVRSID